MADCARCGLLFSNRAVTPPRDKPGAEAITARDAVRNEHLFVVQRSCATPRRVLRAKKT